MKTIVFFTAFACLASVALAQTNTRFSADVLITDSTQTNFIGSFLTRMHYNYVTNTPDNTIVRIDYDSALNPPGVTSSQGPIEVYNYAMDERYLQCDICELETWNEPPLEFLVLAGDSSAGSDNINGVMCDRFNKASPSVNGVSSVWVDPSNGNRICRAQLASGLIYDFSNFGSTTDANLNIFNTFMNCPEPQCGTFVDFCLVLDESGSISSGDFALERDFAGNVIDRFTFDRDAGAQACIVYYSSDPRLVHQLSADQVSVRNAATGRNQANGNTNTGGAMNVATSEMTDNNGRSRPAAAKLMIVLTDGQTNRGPSVQSAADFAEQRGVIRIAIGVGPNVNQNDIENVIPTPPSQVGGAQTSFFVDDFNNLDNALDQIVATTCMPLQGNQCGSGCFGFCTCGQVCVCPDVCDDSNACTNDVCMNNVNGAGCQFNPITCNDQDACTQDTCNTATGCVYTDISANCDDGDVCTLNQCNPNSGCTFPPRTCNDGDICTTDSCDSGTPSGCVYELVAMGNCLCRDVTCTEPDLPCGEYVCQNDDGMCDFIPTVCNDGDMCTTDMCDDNQDACVYTTISCDDGDACTDDFCVGTSGCMNVAFDVATRCDDQTVCTTDSCDIDVGCVNTEISCDDSNVCTDDSCNSISGCMNQPRICSDEEDIRRLLEQTNDGDPCFTADCDPTLPNGCRLILIEDAEIDQCGVCNGDNSTCGDGLDNTDLAAISGGVIAALVLAACALCILLAVASGKGGYDVYLKGKNAMDSATTSPLYDNGGLEGTNPMHEI